MACLMRLVNHGTTAKQNNIDSMVNLTKFKEKLSVQVFDVFNKSSPFRDNRCKFNEKQLEERIDA